MPRRNPELTGDRCERCNGSGNVVADAGGLKIVVKCPDCKGTGLVNSPNACTKCSGSGTFTASFDSLNVEVTCDHCNGSGLEPK